MNAQILTDPERLFAAWLIVACVVLLAVACWREVVAQNRRLEDKRRRKDRAAWLAFMAHEQREVECSWCGDDANLAVAAAFRDAMQRADLRAQVDRIRAAIAANHEKAVTEFRDELDNYTGGAA